MWGDLIVALVQASGKLEYLLEEWDEKSQTATVRIKRLGKPEHVEVFGMAIEAKKAKLADKDLYKSYPQRMCGWRAKSYAIRSQFADVLKGLSVREEVEDYVDIEAVPARAPIATPRPCLAHVEPEAPPQPEPESAGTERTVEDEVSELGEALGYPPAHTAAKLAEHAKKGTLESYRDNLRLELKRKQAEG
jgi:hypothetical protein